MYYVQDFWLQFLSSAVKTNVRGLICYVDHANELILNFLSHLLTTFFLTCFILIS